MCQGGVFPLMLAGRTSTTVTPSSACDEAIAPTARTASTTCVGIWTSTPAPAAIAAMADRDLSVIASLIDLPEAGPVRPYDEYAAAPVEGGEAPVAADGGEIPSLSRVPYGKPGALMSVELDNLFICHLITPLVLFLCKKGTSKQDDV